MLASSATAFFVLMLVGEIAADGTDPTGEGLAVAAAALALAAATLSAWWRVRVSGAALVTAAVAFGVVIALTAGHNVLAVSLLLPAPWLVAGLLLIAADRSGAQDDRAGEAR